MRAVVVEEVVTERSLASRRRRVAHDGAGLGVAGMLVLSLLRGHADLAVALRAADDDADMTAVPAAECAPKLAEELM